MIYDVDTTLSLNLRAALNHGVNFLDTAFFYGTGRSEELIGEVISAAGGRHELILATKGGLTLVGNEVTMDNCLPI